VLRALLVAVIACVLSAADAPQSKGTASKRIVLAGVAPASADANADPLLAVRILAHCLNQTRGIEASAWNGLPPAGVLEKADAVAAAGANPPKNGIRLGDEDLVRCLGGESQRREVVHGVLKHLGITPPAGGAPVALEGVHGWPAWKDSPASQPPAGELLPLYATRAGSRKWQPLVEPATFAGWIQKGQARWEVKDGSLVASGGKGYLFSPRADYKDFELRARVLLEKGGNSGLFFRVAEPAEQKLQGYEAQINHSHRDPVRTGSLFKIANVSAKLIADEGWFDLHVIADGDRIQVRVNGKLTVDVKSSEHAKGHIAIQQHVDGSRVELKGLEVLELP